MLVDFLNCAIGMDGEKLNLMLILGDISGDVGFLGAIMKLCGKYNVLLSQPQTASGDKIYGVRTKWLWNKVATGEDFKPPKLNSRGRDLSPSFAKAVSAQPVISLALYN